MNITKAMGRIGSTINASLAFVVNRMIRVPVMSSTAPNQLQQSLANEQTHLFNIIRCPHHQLTGLVAIMIGERQSLDFGEQLVAQVKRHALRVALCPVSLQKGKKAAD